MNAATAQSLAPCNPSDGSRFGAIARGLSRGARSLVLRACCEPFAVTRNSSELSWVDASEGRKLTRFADASDLRHALKAGLVTADRLGDGLGLITATELAHRVYHHIRRA